MTNTTETQNTLLPSMRVDGQVALVTGASRGIGLAIAQALAESGADVALMARAQPELEQAAATIAARGRRAIPLVCDVSDPAQVEAAIRSLDRLDIVVNNAGTNKPQPFAEVSLANLNLLIDLNMKGTFFVAQQAVQHMQARQQPGVIINISSQMGHVGAVNRSVYCMTKHAVEGLTKALAVELAPAGIRVNSVCPTFIETEMTRPFFANEAFHQSVLASIPMGRIGRVEDVVGAVIFLASPAAALITGASLLVDGGWTAR